MTKLDGKTPDLAEDNIEKMKAIFPDIFEEGKIDFSRLKQDLGEYVDDEKERYNFTWNGKGRALRLSQTPSAGTLRPCPEESKNWGSTKNLYIEGDNLEVLKLLQKSYHGKVKMIYIDPPYNTGNDFVYPDNFADSIENYKKITGQVDSGGHPVSTNSEANGHYHTDWLNMMYPRLRLARNLLTDDGVIFISIDDNEAANLKKICDEVFGEENRIETIIWKSKYGAGAKTVGFISTHEYILCYSKTPLSNITCEFEGEEREKYNKRDEKFNIRGPYRTQPLMTNSLGDRPNLKYTIEHNGVTIVPHKQWVWSKERMFEAIANNDVEFSQQADGSYSVRSKSYLYDKDGNRRRGKPISVLNGPFTQDGTKEMRELFNEKAIFDFSKPSKLIEFFLKLELNDIKDSDYTVLDFFSGSATTAHAVMQLNAEDGGNRRFIMVQLPEPCPEDSEASKAGYKNICEIGKERIRRAGEKIKTEVEEQNAQLKLDEKPKNVPDIGFQVFKLDSSNLKKWNTEAGMVKDYADGSVQLDFSQKKLAEDLQAAAENYIPGRTEQDVVYEIMLKMGFDLTWPVEEKTVAGKKVYVVALGALMLCLENNITPDVAKGIVELHRQLAPETWKVVFRDNGFASDSDKVNVHEILKSAGLEEDAFTTV